MADRRFRFAVMAGWAPDGAAWTGLARRAEELGYATLLTPDTSGGAERLARVERVLDAVAGPPEGLFAGTGRPPRVLVAASRPRMLELAARRADTVAFGVPPMTDDAELAGYVEIVRTAAGARFDDLELCTQVHVVGDDVPEWLGRQMDVDTAAMAASGAIAKLSGTPREMAGTLTRRRDELGVSYVSVSSAFMEEFAPVVELLAGR